MSISTRLLFGLFLLTNFVFKTKFLKFQLFFFARNISLFPGGPGSFSTSNPTASIALLTLPLAA